MDEEKSDLKEASLYNKYAKQYKQLVDRKQILEENKDQLTVTPG
jgi:hypothetical protein